MFNLTHKKQNVVTKKQEGNTLFSHFHSIKMEVFYKKLRAAESAIYCILNADKGYWRIVLSLGLVTFYVSAWNDNGKKKKRNLVDELDRAFHTNLCSSNARRGFGTSLIFPYKTLTVALWKRQDKNNRITVTFPTLGGTLRNATGCCVRR